MNEVIIAHKMVHKGQLFGHVSNGGGTIRISDSIAIKFVALNDKFTQVQVLHSVNDGEIKSQTWVKTPKSNVETVKKKKTIERLDFNLEVQEENLI